ncbi:ATP-binding protein [bacterium]|nr:ATP-binding protein [bacterium]
MKQIVIISGKGGTGKTTVAAALSRIASEKVLVDVDVDAANLEIVTDAKLVHSEPFSDSKLAAIDDEKCIRCDLCRQHCRFDAISVDEDGKYRIDEHSCEGCDVCRLVCPADAISINSALSGTVKKSETPFGTLWHGELSAGRDNSGKMVTYLREKGAEDAQNKQIPYVLIDGAPGVGCQVIASLTGVDLALIVSEPTLSAMHDLERIFQLAQHFRVPAILVINKASINSSLKGEISRWANNQKIPIVAEIPVDVRIVKSMAQRQSPIEIGDEELTAIYKNIWTAVEDFFNEKS